MTARVKVTLIVIVVVVIVLILGATRAWADERDRRERTRDTRNWILERQSAGMVQGPPTQRRIVGRREFDGYRQNGVTVWYEKGNVVGVTR